MAALAAVPAALLLRDDDEDPEIHSYVTLAGHTQTVYSVAFSRDGTTVAAAGADHTARLWRIK